jgi:hypothetical protein
MLDDDTTLADLRARFPRSGRVAWIGLRPAPRAAIRAVAPARLITDAGIEGDHRAARGGVALGVTRKTLSAILNGRSGVSPEMAVRLSLAFGTSSESWRTSSRSTTCGKPKRSGIN